MKSLIVYTSRYGNTERVAFAIAAGLRPSGLVEVLSVDTAHSVQLHGYDLVVLGCPTEGHSTSRSMASYIDSVGDSFTGIAAATFDTRLRLPAWLSGSASVRLAHKLVALGANVVVPAASFLVAGKVPKLEPGELARAEAWGRLLAEKLTARVLVAAS